MVFVIILLKEVKWRVEKLIVLGGAVEWLTTHIAEAIEGVVGKKLKSLKPALALILSLLIVLQLNETVIFTGVTVIDKLVTALVVSFGSRAVHEFYKIFKPQNC